MRWLPLLLACVAGCTDRARMPEAPVARGALTVTLKRQPLGGDEAAFRALLAAFERAHPELRVVDELIPNNTDVAHQFYLTALEGGSQDFDLMVVDVIWVPEFARAGWIADLSAELPRAALAEDFLPGPLEASLVDGRTYAVPWFVDVGLLYYRTDLVPHAPRTQAELVAFAKAAQEKDPSLAGFVWQGRQYEGLNCNVFEAIWAQGGEPLVGGRFALASPAAAGALGHLRRLLEEGVSPPSVTTAAEEEARRLFGAGRAVFMRNWPYAWAEGQKEGSPIRGRFDIARLPGVDAGHPGPGVLGGWQLAVNAHVPPARREAAVKLLRHLTSTEANVVMAVSYARNPPRRSAYASSELVEKAAFLPRLLPHLEAARPRPVTPWYMLVTDTLQGEFSAAIAGLRPPEEALSRAQRLVDHLTGAQE